MLYKVVLTFESVDEILRVTIKMKATERYFPLLLFIMLYKVVLTFEFVDEILRVTIEMKLLSGIFLWCCLLCCTRWF